jgi:hypothetical protein
MVHSFFSAIIASSSLAITRNKDIFFSCPARIETFFIAFLVFMLILVKAVDRFFAVFSAFVKSFIWRNIYCSNF